jgi:hypothetical protein
VSEVSFGRAGLIEMDIAKRAALFGGKFANDSASLLKRGYGFGFLVSCCGQPSGEGEENYRVRKDTFHGEERDRTGAGLRSEHHDTKTWTSKLPSPVCVVVEFYNRGQPLSNPRAHWLTCDNSTLLALLASMQDNAVTFSSAPKDEYLCRI